MASGAVVLAARGVTKRFFGNAVLKDVSIDILSGRIRIGTVVLEIGGETRPCERMDEACSGLEVALKPGLRAGSYCRVLAGGVVKIGDEVTVEPV